MDKENGTIGKSDLMTPDGVMLQMRPNDTSNQMVGHYEVADTISAIGMAGDQSRWLDGTLGLLPNLIEQVK